MLDILLSILAFLITICIVISIHEFGHFIAARLLGIKVLCFSIGFGKKIFRWKGKKGTEYAISAIPLGGYVKMLGENEEEKIAKEDLHLAFNRQPVSKRLAVVCAGPFFNLLFAVFAYWLMFMIGFTTVKPVIGKIVPDSIADMSGLKARQEIVMVDKKKTSDWTAVMTAVFVRIGDEGWMQVKTKLPKTDVLRNYSINLTDWEIGDFKPQPIQSLGIIPFHPEIPAVIGTFVKADPKVKSILKVGDKVLAINNKPITNWYELANQIKLAPNKTLTFKILRDKKIISVSVPVGDKRVSLWKKEGSLGITPEFQWPETFLNKNEYSAWPALKQAYHQTTSFVSLNFILLGKMITGDVSIFSLGGPITIFEGAGAAFKSGVAIFLSFLAFINIAIGIINILPIPGLDGGYICYYLIEAIIRRPIPAKVQEIAFRLGMTVIFFIMFVALFNDFFRLFRP